jgi:branched-chain amino acid transport system ATP-binding protein
MLKIEKLNAYYGEFHVLEDINMEVPRGQVVVLLGPNGHGKSTLLKSICGLVRSVKGNILYKGQNITGMSTSRLVSMGITYIAENRELFPFMTVQENLKLGAFSRAARPHLKENLDMVFTLFPRLAERKKQLASTMSGGEGRMLAIARGLMSNADLLAVDEPSLGLQPNLRLEVFRIIKEINKQGKTILVVEQNIPKIAEMADKIYVLEEGMITFEGDKEKVLSSEHMKEIFLGM